MKELYSFADHPEHKAQLKKWNDKRGIGVALNCAPMDDDDREICRAAVRGMYEAAGLVAPPPGRIAFVSSPLAARLAGGFAAAIWWLRKNPDSHLAKTTELDATHIAAYIATDNETNDSTYIETYNATYAATDNATDAATRISTDAATSAATSAATYNATYNATYIATRNATDYATSGATYNATSDATYSATRISTDAATHDAPDIIDQLSSGEKTLVEFFLNCAKSAGDMWQGGNEWAGWGSYISFFRDIAKLDLPEYQNWKHWEALELHSGIRIVHKDFCIISDRPEYIKMDAQNRPHCVDGPYKKYRDGWSLYYINGVPHLP